MTLARVYAFGALVVVPLYANVVHARIDVSDRWPFVPLLVTSLYCAIGVGGAWLALYVVDDANDDDDINNNNNNNNATKVKRR